MHWICEANVFQISRFFIIIICFYLGFYATSKYTLYINLTEEKNCEGWQNVECFKQQQETKTGPKAHSQYDLSMVMGNPS